MALLEKQLYIKRSNIPNSGKGLFTKKEIPKGTRIVEYTGRVSTWKDANHDDGNNAYIYYITRNRVIDAMHNKTALARYANDAQGLTKVKGIRNNAEYVIENNRVYITAARTIPAGGEIFVAYGKEYWQVIRYNKKITAQEERIAAESRNMMPAKKKKAKKKKKGK